jgi:hypothetical protein
MGKRRRGITTVEVDCRHATGIPPRARQEQEPAPAKVAARQPAPKSAGAVPPPQVDTNAQHLQQKSAGSAPSAEMTKQLKKRLKKQRQKERHQEQQAQPSSTPAAAFATDIEPGDIDDIFGSHSSTSTCAVEEAFDEDEEVLVAEDMGDLEAIFADKRSQMEARAGAARTEGHAPRRDGGDEWDYTGSSSKERKQVDGFMVYSEAEHTKTAMSDVKGKLDGPCPFDCSCCF